MLTLSSRHVRQTALVVARRRSHPTLLRVCGAHNASSSSAQPDPTAPAETLVADRSRAFVKEWKTLAAVGLSLSVGFALGQSYRPPPKESDHDQHHRHALPNGLPRTCCDTEDKLTEAQKALPAALKKIVGHENVLDGRMTTTHTAPFLRGARLGQGRALCIVTPRFLQDVVDVVQAIIDADAVVLPQGQNTGLTGGSVPRNYYDGNNGEDDEDYRPVVLVSLKHLNRIFPIDDGQRLVCLAGTGLAQVIQFLQSEFPHRESHSTLGSTFLNPTTAAGVAFGSGGTQVRKGPAYTERALYLKVTTNKWKEKIVEVVNTLGIEGMEDPESERARKMDSVPSRVDTWSRWIAGGYDRTSKLPYFSSRLVFVKQFKNNRNSSVLYCY